jgi:glycine/D-amino acid oxidase-like deaminating enzyme
MGDGPVWRTGDGTGFPPVAPDARQTADVCVIGLGGSGLSAVAEARRLGRSVVGVDAGEVACGAAGRNGGFLLAGTPDFHHRAGAALGRGRVAAIYALTLGEIDAMERTLPGVVRRVGSLRVGDSAEEVEDCVAMLDALRADGFEASWHDGPEGSGVLLPGDGAFDPLARCRVLAGWAAAEGAVLYERSPVVSFGDGVVEVSGGGRISCRAVVIAVDGGLERLVPSLVGRVRTARLQMLATEPVGRVVTERPVYARWGFDYWQQLPSGAVALGGCRDRFMDAEWTHQAVPTADVQACLDALLRDRVGVNATVTHRWAGAVSFTPDHMPVCEEVQPNVVATGGYCGTGNVLGALCGRAAVRLAVGEDVGELAPLLSAQRGSAGLSGA